MKPWFKRKKNLECYQTLLAELWLEDEYNYNIILRTTSENFEEIFQLIKDDITKENTEIRELILPRLQLAATIGFLSTGELYYSTMNSSTFSFFLRFILSIFSSLIKNTNHLIKLDFFWKKFSIVKCEM